jgi:hypothetical protein
VKRCFDSKPYVNFEKTQFYTIEELEKGVNETDEFFIRFKDDPDYQKDIETIKYWIQKIGKESGALERHFRPEKSAKAIPITVSKLRLYCYRISEELVILGNGGIKSSQKVQDSPDAFPHFEVMNTLAFVIQLKLETGQIEISGKTISGDLKFFIK